jgi:hypothetical protein
MCWILLVLVAAPVVTLCAYRYCFGKWPLRFEW